MALETILVRWKFQMKVIFYLNFIDEQIGLFVFKNICMNLIIIFLSLQNVRTHLYNMYHVYAKETVSVKKISKNICSI